MSQPVISVENLSKAYRIGLKDEVPDTLVGAMTNIARSPFKNFKRLRSLDTFRDVKSGHGDSDDILWALKDVSFDVQEGEVVGIIGRNGAGKSTLLKILSRITEPTSGRVKIRGRVSSLLEVGTGFHPELTGRENIYLNGTILGMTKREIDSKFDEIVDFSGVEKFLDTPVKRYSSGMKVRLAFAVAAHLEPEILIIDEVLAVGDAEFQKKCLGKMDDVAAAGKTVIFVSHNHSAVERLCQKVFWLSNGKTRSYGNASEIISCYLEEITESGLNFFENEEKRIGLGNVRIAMLDSNPPSGVLVAVGDPFTIKFQIVGQIMPTKLVISIRNSRMAPVIGLETTDFVLNEQRGWCGRAEVTCDIYHLLLESSDYYISYSLFSSLGLEDRIENALKLTTHGHYLQEQKLRTNRSGQATVFHRWKCNEL